MMNTEPTKYENCMNELNELKELFHSLRSNCEFKGKDSEGAVHYHFEPGYNASLALTQVHSHIKAIESFLKEYTAPPKSIEAVELLNWIDNHPATANRLESVTTKSGVNIQLREGSPDPGISLLSDNVREEILETVRAPHVGYTIEELQKEWNAYVFVLNSGNGPRDKDGALLGFRSFVEFLQIPHDVIYADDAIYAVEFDDVLDNVKE